MTALYSEIEEYPADWTRNLIRAGFIAPGRVITGDIREIDTVEIARFTQAHFFAGFGTWSYALRLAGWPDDAEVWTGSCPCQPFSNAGRKRGTEDDRHLWPDWLRLVEQHLPPVLFGEQVASPSGRRWLSAVQTDLEALGYSVGAADLCAAGVGAPHARQRLFFGAVRTRPGSDADVQRCALLRLQLRQGRQEQAAAEDAGGGSPVPVAHGDGAGLEVGDGGPSEHPQQAGRSTPERGVPARGVGHADSKPARGHSGGVPRTEASSEGAGRLAGGVGDSAAVPSSDSAGPCRGFWSDARWVECSDGTTRPTGPGVYPLADGAPGRVAQLRAVGNAIVPQVAAAFVSSFIDVILEDMSE